MNETGRTGHFRTEQQREKFSGLVEQVFFGGTLSTIMDRLLRNVNRQYITLFRTILLTIAVG